MNLMYLIQIWKHSVVHIFQGCLTLGLWNKIRRTPYFLKRIKETFFFYVLMKMKSLVVLLSTHY